MVCHFDDTDDEALVLDGIEDSIDAAANSIAVFRGQFLATGRPRLVGQRLDSTNDAAAIPYVVDRFYFFDG